MGFASSDMVLTSTAIKSGEPIPVKYTGDGDDISPPFEWHNAPAGTRSFALVCHDPDAPLVSTGRYGFVHWVLYNIPDSTNGVPEGVLTYTPGQNNFDKTGYGGPAPPKGHGKHHYFFWLLALAENMGLDQGLSLWQLLEQVEPHVIGMNRVVGTYER